MLFRSVALLPAKAPTNQVRHLDEERTRVAAEAWDYLRRERMARVVVNIVVVTDIERGSGTRRPAGQELSTHARVQRVVIDDGAREVGLGELIGTTPRQNVDVKRCQAGVMTHQALLV